MTSAPPYRPPHRPWTGRLQFKLRTLLIAIAVIGVWLGIKLNAARQQHAAILGIRALGGWTYYDYQIANQKYLPTAQPWEPAWLLAIVGLDFFHDVVVGNMVYNDDLPTRVDNKLVTDEVKAYLPALGRLEELLLYDSQATDDCLRVVGQVRNLERIYMWDATKVTDVGVAHLRSLPRLKYIHLTKSQITDESLRIFATMPQLDGLCLEENSFTDKGLAQLKDLHRLQELYVGLGKTNITDASVDSLMGLTNLKMLDLQKTKVTPEAVEKLKAAIPGLKVWDP